jgi:hypothetical protein
VAGEKFPVRFDQGGTFTVIASVDGISAGSLIVHVVYVDFDGPVACQVGYKREKGVAVYGPTDQVFFTAKDPALLEVSVKEVTSYGVRLYLKALGRGTPVVQARLGSATGPVLSEQELDEFILDTSAVQHLVVNGETDTANSIVTMSPWIPNIDVNFAMFAHYSTFAGGATAYTLNTSDQTTVDINGDPTIDLSVDPSTGETQAVIRVDIEIPPGESSYCFAASFDQHSRYGSETGWIVVNGSACRFKVPETVRYVSIGQPSFVTIWVDNPFNHYVSHTIGKPAHPLMLVKNDDASIKITTAPAAFNCFTEPSSVVNFPLTFTANDKPGWYDVSIHGTKFAKRVCIVKVDVQVDSDNNCVIEDSKDSLVEDAYPGKAIFLNRDDDDCDRVDVTHTNDVNDGKDLRNFSTSVTEEDDLAEVQLSITPVILGANVRLSFTYGGKFRVWKSSSKGNSSDGWAIDQVWPIEKMPKSVWVEGMSVGVVDFGNVTLTYYPEGGTAAADPAVSDSAVLCVIDTVFSKHANTRYGYDDGLVTDDPIPNPRPFDEITSPGNPGGQNGQLYDWVNVSSKSDAPNNKTVVTLTINPAACAPYVYIMGEYDFRASASPAQAASAVQAVTITGGDVFPSEANRGLTKVQTRLGSPQGAFAGIINVGVYKRKLLEMNWVTVRKNAADNFAVDPVAIRTGANALLKQLIVESKQKRKAPDKPELSDPVEQIAPYDFNNNGKLDIWEDGVTIPPGQANEAFLLGLGTTWPGLSGKIIYVNDLTVNGVGSAAGFSIRVPGPGDGTIFINHSSTDCKYVLAHESAHLVGLFDHAGTASTDKNKTNMMRTVYDAARNFFGYFRVRREVESGVTPGFDVQWNKVIR